MNDSLFWQDGFPKERRVELVANLLYAKDPHARIPNNEGLRPDRVDDFYATVGFSSIDDFEDRMEAVWAKHRYGESSREIEAPKSKVRRPRAPRVTIPEQPIVPVPVRRIEPALEAPAVETPIIEAILPTSDVRRPTADLHPEDRVSAFARSVLAWFGGTSQHADRTEMPSDAVVDSARMRETVFDLVTKEFGSNLLQEDIHADPKARAHLETANRLERAIATSAHLAPRDRNAMQEQLAALRTEYQERMQELVRARSAALQELLEGVSIAEHDGALQTAVHVLAAQTEPLSDRVTNFRAQIEHVAMQRDGVGVVAEVNAEFQRAWQETWNGQMTPVDIGPLEASLPQLRLLEETAGSGVAQLVAKARVSIQEDIDRRLPMVEREMKRAA